MEKKNIVYTNLSYLHHNSGISISRKRKEFRFGNAPLFRWHALMQLHAAVSFKGWIKGSALGWNTPHELGRNIVDGNLQIYSFSNKDIDTWNQNNNWWMFQFDMVGFKGFPISVDVLWVRKELYYSPITKWTSTEMFIIFLQSGPRSKPPEIGGS